MEPKYLIKPALATFALCFSLTPAQAVNVSFNGLILNSCILTIDTPGRLAPSLDGLQLNSELGIGISSIVAIAALGLRPTIRVSAPVADEPAGQTGSVAEIRYTSLSGANQPYTTQASTASSFLIDTFIFDARLTNENGFVGGSYEVISEVTCQQ